MHQEKNTYKIIAEFQGHASDVGAYAGVVKNNYRLVEDSDGNRFYEMDVDNNNNKIFFDEDDLFNVKLLVNPISGRTKKPTWYINSLGYPSATSFKNRKGTYDCIYLHRLLMGEKFSRDRYVDHINGNKLDNRRSNLRITSQAHQNNNQNIRENKKK